MPYLNLDERYRLAHTTGDTATLALIEQAEDEMLSGTVSEDAHSELQDKCDTHESKAQGLARILDYLRDTLRAAKPLRKTQMRNLADLIAEYTEDTPDVTWQLVRAQDAIERAAGLPMVSGEVRMRRVQKQATAVRGLTQ